MEQSDGFYYKEEGANTQGLDLCFQGNANTDAGCCAHMNK